MSEQETHERNEENGTSEGIDLEALAEALLPILNRKLARLSREERYTP